MLERKLVLVVPIGLFNGPTQAQGRLLVGGPAKVAQHGHTLLRNLDILKEMAPGWSKMK